MFFFHTGLKRKLLCIIETKLSFLDHWNPFTAGINNYKQKMVLYVKFIILKEFLL